MKLPFIALTILLALIFTNCHSPKPGNLDSDQFSSAPSIENPDFSISLVEHLRRVPGVQINGSGPNASITIRGLTSINGSNEPLFVIDGQPLSGGLSAAVQMVPVEQIQRIHVLKNPEDTGIYGVRGANGVIEITLKRSVN